MPKKQKKTVNKKTKLKNTVNVKINIDNSKKTTARRAPTKNQTPPPFVNFPSYQPARVQQLEPIKKYNSPDLSKTDDMYQKQIKTYLETTDKAVKDIIEKFDDTLKKNTAPPKPPEESNPGASIVYADYENKPILEVPIPKINIKQPSKKTVSWSKPNELKQNKMLETEVESFGINQLFEEAKPLNIKEVVRGLDEQELIEGIKEAKNMTLEQNIFKKYDDYVKAYKKFYDDDNYLKMNDMNSKGSPITTALWGSKVAYLKNEIENYGTNKNKQELLAKQKQQKEQNKKSKKQPQTTVI